MEFGIAGYEKDVKSGKDREGVDDIGFGSQIPNGGTSKAGQNPFN